MLFNNKNKNKIKNSNGPLMSHNSTQDFVNEIFDPMKAPQRS